MSNFTLKIIKSILIMKIKTFTPLLVGLMVLSCAPKQEKLVYPTTEKKIVTDTFFGTQVEDPDRKSVV